MTSPDDLWKRAFDIHKNCDQMLHQRLTAFTALQAFAIAAYTTLTIARFQAAVPSERIVWFEFSRVSLIAFGIVTAIFGWMVTFPMLVRLRYLNDKYLFTDPIYKSYMLDAHLDQNYNKLLLEWPKTDTYLRKKWLNYRYVIPILLPLFEISLWSIFLVALIGAWISTWLFGTPPVSPCK